MLDHVVCALDGHRSRLSTILRQALPETSGGATAIGDGRLMSPLTASFLNGTATFAHNYCDTSFATLLHGESVIAPAALTTAQSRNASVEDALLAMVVGYEVAERFGRVLETGPTPRGHFSRGFHVTGSVAVAGAAAAAAKAAGADSRTIERALALAAGFVAGCPNSAIMGPSSLWLSAGKAAHDGVLALALAEKGALATSDAVVGDGGMFEAYSGGPDTLNYAWLSAPASESELMLSSFSIKLFATSHTIAAPVEATVAVRRAAATEEAPEGIRVRLPELHYRISGQRPMPCRTFPEAQGSVQFSVATAWLYGDVTPADLYRALDDAQVHELAERCSVEVDDRLTRMQEGGLWPSAVDVSFRGRTESAEVRMPEGSVERPLDRPAVLSKLTRQPGVTQEVSEMMVLLSTAMDANGPASRLPLPCLTNPEEA
jgi:2-methylcitrate dehydratase PrpD